MRIIARVKDAVVGNAEIGNDDIYIGRSRQNQLVLKDSGVSRRHAKVFVQDGHIYLEDLKTINGTLLKGEKIRRAPLQLGDTFRLGPFELTLEPSPQPQEEEDAHPEDTMGTTFAEAATDVNPDEHTLPPISHPSSSEGISDNFLEAIAIRPSRPEAAVQDEMRVLKSFLESGDEVSEPSAGEKTPPESTLHENPRLIRLDGDDVGKETRIEKDQVTLGRAPESDVVVEGEDVADRHAKIERTDAGYVLHDAPESTGTFVDGVPVRERTLESHDVVNIGDARFEYLEGDAQSRAQQPKVVERSSRPGRMAIPRFASDWRFLLVASVSIGLLVVVFLAPSPPPETAPPSTSATSAQPEDESTRVARFNLNQAQIFLKKKKYDDAEARVRLVLNRISPNHPDAIRLLDEIDQARSEEKRTRDAARKDRAEAEQKIQSILVEGDRLREQKKYIEARRVYLQALNIDAESQGARAALEELEERQETDRREAAARKKTVEQVKKTYTAGVQKFEAGDYGGAQQLLREVASKKGHPYQASAQKLLDEIRARAEKKLQDKVDGAKKLLDHGEVLKAYEDLSTVVKQFPRQKDAGRYLVQAKAAMEAKAKQAYTEGIAYQDLVEDPAAALDRYEEALRYAPDPKSEYHVKAKQRLDQLKLKSSKSE